MKRIVCFHLFNDYSGSPKVLRMVLQGILEKNYQVDLITSVGGVLDGLRTHPYLRLSTYPYHFSENPAITMLRYLAIQLYTFLLAFRYTFNRNTVFYVNTLLPVGPALAGRIMGKCVVYHYHENAAVKGTFYRTLCWCMKHLASKIICVSEYQRSFLECEKNIRVIPNTIPDTFVERLMPDVDCAFIRKRVLMLGSLKLYKGTLEFFQLAVQLPQYTFELVLNDTQDNIDRFLIEHNLTIRRNLKIHSRQNDVVPFYNRASLVLNLSDKNLVVETFGLTVLEAMSAGVPVIVPTVGGIAEMVEDGVNGYKIDVRHLDKIAAHIQMILSDKNLYKTLAYNALEYSKRYNCKAMIGSVLSHINS